MSTTLLQLFNKQVAGELVPGNGGDSPWALRLTGVDAATFLALAGIGSATAPVEIRIELDDADIAYLQAITDKAPDEMIRVVHLVWGDALSNEPTTISTFLVR